MLACCVVLAAEGVSLPPYLKEKVKNHQQHAAAAPVAADTTTHVTAPVAADAAAHVAAPAIGATGAGAGSKRLYNVPYPQRQPKRLRASDASAEQLPAMDHPLKEFRQKHGARLHLPPVYDTFFWQCSGDRSQLINTDAKLRSAIQKVQNALSALDSFLCSEPTHGPALEVRAMITSFEGALTTAGTGKQFELRVRAGEYVFAPDSFYVKPPAEAL